VGNSREIIGLRIRSGLGASKFESQSCLPKYPKGRSLIDVFKVEVEASGETGSNIELASVRYT
jgi:hypothetical protein